MPSSVIYLNENDAKWVTYFQHQLKVENIRSNTKKFLMIIGKLSSGEVFTFYKDSNV